MWSKDRVTLFWWIKYRLMLLYIHLSHRNWTRPNYTLQRTSYEYFNIFNSSTKFIWIITLSNFIKSFFCFSNKCMNHEHIIIKIQKNSSLVLGTKSFYRNNERFKVQWCYLLYKENTFLSSIHFEENESLAGEKYISTMILYTILDDRRISWKLNDPKQITFSIHFV